ncbi:GAF domain-containing protein [Mycobacterium sp. 4D054]|uniref:GAF domain-containing protein n=1 Tax=Mycobacterium sp. 4D054 TaxID=3457440 RepID=UPI003FD04639
MNVSDRHSVAFGRWCPEDLRRIHEQLDELAADRDQLGELLQVAIEINSGLELDATLHRIVRAAKTMTAARYGAIGVWGEDGALASFIYDGMDEKTAAAIGGLPVGKGLLGFLRDGTAPVRLSDLAEHPASAGLPDGHPPLRAFLGMPIQVRGKPFGSLYLADDRGDFAFAEADETSARALASVAAVAIDNARLFGQARAAARWTDASREITAAVLCDDDPYLRPLQLIVRRVCELTDAEQGIVLVPADPEQPQSEVDTLVVSAAYGCHVDDVLDQRVPIEGSTTGAVFRSGEPVITEAFRRPIRAFTDVGERPAIVVPLRSEQQCLGVLAVARNDFGPRFDTAYLDLVRDFADHTAIALTMARARCSATELAMLTDRERIAHDLHDQVIQRVFAVGMDLQGLSARVRPPEASERLSSCIDELQAVISEIRSTIFNLQKPVHGAFAKRIRHAFHRLTEDRDVAATLSLSGPMGAVDPPLADDAEAVVLEGLSNAVRHLGASAISVEITVGDDLIIGICDNGRGLAPGDQRRSGLANLAASARAAGGDFAVDLPPSGGTRLTWSAPLSSA